MGSGFRGNDGNKPTLQKAGLRTIAEGAQVLLDARRLFLSTPGDMAQGHACRHAAKLTEM
jgi:hypothetical protein